MSAASPTGEALARALLGARTSGRPLAAMDAPGPLAESDAYAAQAWTMSALAPLVGPVAAWKTGRTQVGGPMTMAPIPAKLLRPTPARFTSTESCMRLVELEVAFRLDADPPPADARGFETAMRGIVSVLPVIEVIDARLAEGVDADPLLRLADLLFNAGLVVGEARPLGAAPSLERCFVRIEIAGRMAIEGLAEPPGGDAFATFCAFARTVGDHCGGLRAGHLVTTGGLKGLVTAPLGARVTGVIEGLGDVEVAFER